MIKYKSGFKYQLARTYKAQTPIKPDEDIHYGYISLFTSGVMEMRAGYSSDGPSGPSIDTKSFMRGAFEHDGFYELLRNGLLPQSLRDEIDRLLQQRCIEDGMWKVRAWGVYTALKYFGAKAAHPDQKKIIYTAP